MMRIIDSVGESAIARKKLLDSAYKNAVGDNVETPLKWYRTRKNSDLKDALTLEGIKRGFSVRAEKVMGALPEYCEVKDQNNFNRFDLSWEKVRGSRDFSLAVEIEMDINVNSIIRDFSKLKRNKSDCLKVMICQARNEFELEQIKESAEAARVFNILCQPSFHKSMWPSSRPSKWM
ncbi:hypothetical protein Q5L94_09570, partial [Idiomarina sp. Sol25]|uniref:hypothetical protein n=1 Tax=Idiomarina sp. Sol25 TaxID=3064000 RepID=UPI00294B3402